MQNKPHRNAPCHCGSGHKYKKCHLDEDKRIIGDQKKSVPTNAFRDELAKAEKCLKEEQVVIYSGGVSIPRDQDLLRLQLRFQEELVGMSAEHLTEVVERIELHLEVLQGLPGSNGKLKVIAGVTQQLETTKQALAGTKVGWQDRAYSAALEALIDGGEEPSADYGDRADSAPPETPTKTPTMLAIENAISPKTGNPDGMKMGPIQTDDDDDLDDDD